jgi:hypothetical protein
MRLLTLLVAPAAVVLLGATAAAADKDDSAGQTKADLASFQGYLEKNYAGKKWQAGPAHIDGEAVRAAYGGRRFYYVFSSPPLPPGANVPALQEAYRRNLADFQKNFISLTVAIGAEDKVVPFKEPADFNQGLMKVAGDDDAATAAAAILSLYGSDRVGPGAVAAKDVKVTKNDKGWSCQVQKLNAFQGTVSFNAEGKCTSVSKLYAGPLPP